MAKEKDMPKESKESKESESVRGKLDSVAKRIGDFSSLIDNLKEQNDEISENTFYTAINTSETVKGLNDLKDLTADIKANVSTMTKAMLGLEIKNDEGKVFEPTGLGSGDLVATNFILTNISNNIADMVEHILKIPATMLGQSSSLQNKENDKEKKKEDDEDDKQMESIAKTLGMSLTELKEMRKDMRKGGILDILVIGAALLAGFVTGLVQQIVSYFGRVTKFVKGAASKIDPIIDVLSKGWSSFTKALSGISKFFGSTGSMIKSVFSTFVSGITYFIDLFKEIASTFNRVLTSVRFMFSGGKAITSVFDDLVKYFKGTLQIFGKIFEAGKAFGSVIAKLAFPLTVIMGIFDSVGGALDGWNNTEGSYFDKFIGALKGGLSGLVNGLIGGLLDLLKDGVSWVLNWFGAKDAAAWLDSFSFKDIFTSLISNFVDAVIGFISDVFGAPVRIIKDMMSAVEGKMDWGDFFKRTLANIVGFLLAPVQALGKLAGLDVTKKALDMMGLPSTDVKGGGGGSGEQLTSAQKTNTDEKTKMEEAKMAGSGTAIVQGGQSVTNNISNGGGAAVIKSSTTNWEPDDQWARGGMNWGA
jgi:hypothetical protein